MLIIHALVDYIYCIILLLEFMHHGLFVLMKISPEPALVKYRDCN